MQGWRNTQRGVFGPVERVAGSFAADVDAYLARVSAMPTFKQRQKHLEHWLQALGRDRPRAGITAAEIDAVLQGWLQNGLAPSTVRKRRTALLSLWHTLDGRGQPNPVRSSRNPREPKAEIRAVDLATIVRIVEAMPESRTKRRIAVFSWTGIPPALLSQITPADVDWRAKTLRVSPRRKGHGAPARVVPLLPQAVTALKAYHRHQDYGPYKRNWTVYARRSFLRAAHVSAWTLCACTTRGTPSSAICIASRGIWRRWRGSGCTRIWRRRSGMRNAPCWTSIG
jgi:integrase